MSYGGGYGQPPQGGQYPPQGNSPYNQQPQFQPPPMNNQQSYGAPPGPPPGQYGAPPGQYGAPQGQYGPPQGQYGAPHGQYGPPQGQYGAPQGQYGAPQGQYGAPQGQYGAPQGQYGPPQGQYGAPQGQYGAPQGQYGAPPPQPNYNAPQQYGVGPAPASTPPTPRSPGYDPSIIGQADPAHADALRRAMKGMGTDEKLLCSTLAHIQGPVQMAAVRADYHQRLKKDLFHDIAKETTGHFGEACEAVVRGPLEQDVHRLHEAISGPGTDEHVLDDVLLGRSNADMRAIKYEYHQKHHRQLEQDLKGDLSGKTETLFMMVIAATRAEDSAPVIPQQLENDISDLRAAMRGAGTDEIAVCHVFASRSDGQLRAIAQGFQQKYQTPLSKEILKEFSGHMESALIRMLAVAEDRAMADAQALENTMSGPGTRDRLLLNRIVAIHWNRDHMQQVKGAYRHRFKKELAARVKGETSGDFERILLALIG